MPFVTALARLLRVKDFCVSKDEAMPLNRPPH